jgi:hypothetical protein
VTQAFVLVLPPDPALVGTPAATPTGAAIPDPLTVVRELFEAINRGDIQAVVALWTDDGFLRSGAGFACQEGCRGRNEIQAAYVQNWFPNLPTTEVLQQTSPTTVVVRGQGAGDRAQNTFHEVTYEVRGGLIRNSEAGSFTTCALAPLPSICPSYVPPPPVVALPTSAPSTPAALAAAGAVAPNAPAQPAGPRPVRDNGVSRTVVLGGLSLLGAAALGLLIVAVGLIVRRATRSRTPP